MNEFTIEKIGIIDRGCDGSSEFLLVTCRDDDTTPYLVEDYLLTLYYRNTNTPGAYFCHRITATPYPHSKNKVIAIVHHEYNN
jgi:hypothetical protein